MKLTSNFISLVLSLVGGIVLLSSLVNYFFLLFFAQWENPEWQITATSNAVAQGITPLIAIALLTLGWWVNDNHKADKPNVILRGSVFGLASLLGLIFLLFVPLHLGNVNNVSSELFAQIEQRVAQQQGQIQALVGQLEAISQDPEGLQREIERQNQFLQAGEVNGQPLSQEQLQNLSNQKNQLEEILALSQNPEQLKAKIQEVRGNLENELRQVEVREKGRAQTILYKEGLAISINSFILAIAYMVIGGFGLRLVIKG